MGNKDKVTLKRLSVELERLAGELVRLDGGAAESPPEPAAGGERPADRLGRPQSFVSNYERGTRRLEVSEFIQIARLLGVDAAAVVAEIAAEV